MEINIPHLLKVIHTDLYMHYITLQGTNRLDKEEVYYNKGGEALAQVVDVPSTRETFTARLDGALSKLM